MILITFTKLIHHYKRGSLFCFEAILDLLQPAYLEELLEIEVRYHFGVNKWNQHETSFFPVVVFCDRIIAVILVNVSIH